MMNLIVSASCPMAAARNIGSGFDQPKSVSSESMPQSSAMRQKRACASMSGRPVAARLAACPREVPVVSPPCISRQ
jgi:hypothetical protein